MNWFVSTAPIRLKLMIAFGSMAVLVASTPLLLVFTTGGTARLWGLAATAAAAVLGYWYREAIAGPYVKTVVRMEALAAGDLASEIAFTDYRDCVGRLTKAMFAFRAAAQEQIALNAEAQANAAIVRGMTVNFRRLAEGDLTAEIVEHYPESYAELRTSFNAAVVSLRDLIGSVRDSSTAIRAGSGEISGATEDLARRTEANAAALEQTAAAITQMDQRLRAASEAASRIVESADGTLASVSEGRGIADEGVRAMGRVSDSAQAIDSVIEGVDKIAFQTRVLAMNAAVEAGRAGEAGRGFAIVADLVSALAMRAEEEAGRARSQLSATQSGIVEAVGMVERINGALAGISDSVGTVHTLLGVMVANNHAQSTAIGEISSTVHTLEQSTQRNAAMVEETSAATRNLQLEIENLDGQASRFKVAGAAPDRPLLYAVA